MEETKTTKAGQKDAAAKKGASKTAVARGRKKSNKKKLPVPHGKAFIQATYNNTIVSLADLNGNILSWASAGGCGFSGPKKSTPYAASMVVKTAVERAADHAIKEVNVFVSGVGQGRESAIRAFNANGVNVLSIQDVTPIPHNGCRPPRPRRV